MTTCPICCADYNKALRSQVTCYFPSCSFSGCKECVRTYLTSVTTDPHCMNCRNKWSLEFTKSALNAAFMDKDYKAHRRTILVDREIAKTPEYYEGALRHANLTESDQKGGGTGRKFVMQCQNNGCRGMLTTQYKCDLCTKFTCTKCFVCIVDGTRDEHECKPEDVATVEELRKNTRPCPACGLRISKIDGCDQMWCVECKTAFSWSKGTVENGTVHNPHYYQWMREHGGGMPPTQGNNCEGRDFAEAFQRFSQIRSDAYNMIRCYESLVEEVRKYGAQNTMETKLAQDFESTLPRLNRLSLDLSSASTDIIFYYQFIVHMENTQLHPLQTVLRRREMKKTHIYDYILNVIGKDELADELIRIDGQNMKDRAECDILEALVAVGKQIMTDGAHEFIAEAAKYPDLRTTRYTMYNPEMLISLLTALVQILKKHLDAAERYSVYSNIEYIKMLMVYSSKKGVTLWDHNVHNRLYIQFRTKAQMREFIELLNDFYNGVSSS